MVLSLGKCHYLIINRNIANESIELCKKTLHGQVEQKLLGIVIEKGLNFQSHTKTSTLNNILQKVAIVPFI